jgi:acetolactate synthase regulatory subunit
LCCLGVMVTIAVAVKSQLIVRLNDESPMILRTLRTSTQRGRSFLVRKTKWVKAVGGGAQGAQVDLIVSVDRDS